MYANPRMSYPGAPSGRNNSRFPRRTFRRSRRNISSVVNPDLTLATPSPQWFTTVIGDHLDSGVSSDSSGVINKIITLDFSGSTEFEAAAELFDEYRLTHVTLMLSIANQYATSPTLVRVVFDSDDNTTLLGGYDNAASYARRLAINVGQSNTLIHKLSAKIPPLSGSQAWATTGSAEWIGSFKIYGTGLTASSLVFQAELYARVQFRSRR
jgi:hypothetical protein